MGLFFRTIGLARAHAVITVANMAYNMKRWCWLLRRPVADEGKTRRKGQKVAVKTYPSPREG